MCVTDNCETGRGLDVVLWITLDCMSNVKLTGIILHRRVVREYQVRLRNLPVNKPVF